MTRDSKAKPWPRIEDINLEEAQRLRLWLIAEGGYLDARVLPDGSVAGINDLMFTRSIALGCSWDGWSRRYCFEDRELADQRFQALQSEDDVPEGSVANRFGLESFKRR